MMGRGGFSASPWGPRQSCDMALLPQGTRSPPLPAWSSHTDATLRSGRPSAVQKWRPSLPSIHPPCVSSEGTERREERDSVQVRALGGPPAPSAPLHASSPHWVFVSRTPSGLLAPPILWCPPHPLGHRFTSTLHTAGN